MPRFLVICLFGLCACGPPKKEVKTGGTGGSGAKVMGQGSGSSVTAGSAAPIADAPDVGCLAPSCAYHAGAASYFTCLAGGAGVCFHFGGPCAPADACMFDTGDRTYKQCGKPVEGRCQQWGAACAPAKNCMFSPADGLHHMCDDLQGGTCKRFGALCSP